jgi:hypothetical protein
MAERISAASVTAAQAMLAYIDTKKGAGVNTNDTR